mgnify:CR=1 FL=1
MTTKKIEYTPSADERLASLRYSMEHVLLAKANRTSGKDEPVKYAEPSYFLGGLAKAATNNDTTPNDKVAKLLAAVQVELLAVRYELRIARGYPCGRHGSRFCTGRACRVSDDADKRALYRVQERAIELLRVVMLLCSTEEACDDEQKDGLENLLIAIIEMSMPGSGTPKANRLLDGRRMCHKLWVSDMLNPQFSIERRKVHIFCISDYLTKKRIGRCGRTLPSTRRARSRTGRAFALKQCEKGKRWTRTTWSTGRRRASTQTIPCWLTPTRAMKPWRLRVGG